MNRLMELINRKFIKDIELLEIEDNELVVSCEYIGPHNAHYKEYLIKVNNDNKIDQYIVCCKFK